MASRLFGFSTYPEFKLGEPRFSQDTFLGRWLHLNDIIDPRTLFTSKKSLLDAMQLLDDYQNNRLSQIDETLNVRLWKAQKIKQSMIHPDTGDKILMPFRMSGFVPFGSPIVLGLLLPNQSLAQVVFWQWLNQSHNACVNYANRNATRPTSVSTFIKGYCGAITTAVSIAVGLSLLLRKSRSFKPATKMLVQRFIPFPAVALASTCNVLLMRWPETREGIEVFDSKGTMISTSKIAAKKALRDTAITRALLPAPLLLIPPAAMNYLEKRIPMTPKVNLFVNGFICTLSFGLALPAVIALFPQRSKINRRALEPAFADLSQEEYLVYNKGL